MIECSGIAYGGGSSESFEGAIRVDERGTVELEIQGESKAYPRSEYEVEPRLGTSNRVIRFRDGSRFETEDLEAFSLCEERFQKSGLLSLVDWMESRWPIAIGSLIGIVLFSFAFLNYGVPLIARYVAFEVPQSLRTALSNQSLDTMERYGSFEESYSMKTHESANSAFERGLKLLGDNRSEEFDYELRIFKAPGIGANAFALPSGLIVATEEFVKLCETEEQMVAVFLHEFAHVEQQHGIRSLIQDAGVFIVVSLVLGDLSSLGGMAASLPALAIESRYSRNFETEADLFAGRILEESGIGAESMKEILVLLHRGSPDIDFASFLATHPELEERLRSLEEFVETDGAE